MHMHRARENDRGGCFLRAWEVLPAECNVDDRVGMPRDSSRISTRSEIALETPNRVLLARVTPADVA